MQIKDVMSSEVQLVNLATTIDEASRKMKENDIGILPVADGDRLAGMVTDRDIVLRGVAEGRDLTKTTVRDVMSDSVLYCYEDQSPDEVLSNMGRIQVRRLPVLNRDKRLVGIVSLGDLAIDAEGGMAGEALEEISRTSH